MQAFDSMEEDVAPAPTSTTSSASTGPSRLLNSALSVAGSAAGRKRASPYDKTRPDRWRHDKFDAGNGGGGGSTRVGSGGKTAASGAGAPSPSLTTNHASRKLKLTNLHYELSEYDLRTLFEDPSYALGPLARAPEIVYDRSGRSTGVGFVLFERVEDAVRAKGELDGQLAYGEVIGVEYVPYAGEREREKEKERERKGRGSGGGAPSSRRDDGRGGRDLDGIGAAASGGRKAVPLLQRVSGPALITRLDRRSNERGVRSTSNSNSGGGARGAGARTSAGGGRGAPSGPKTAGDLDAELEAFMKTPALAAPRPGAGAGAGGDADVEMA